MKCPCFSRPMKTLKLGTSREEVQKRVEEEKRLYKCFLEGNYVGSGEVPLQFEEPSSNVPLIGRPRYKKYDVGHHVRSRCM